MSTETNVKNVLEQRGNTYGEFKDVARTTQLLYSLMSNEHRYLRPRSSFLALYSSMPNKHLERTHSMDMALYMIASKLARIVNGDPTHIDSWVDIAGYAQLIVDELEKDNVHK